MDLSLENVQLDSMFSSLIIPQNNHLTITLKIHIQLYPNRPAADRTVLIIILLTNRIVNQ